MKTQGSSSLTWILLLKTLSFFLITGISTKYNTNPERDPGKVYRISEESHLTITGTTNVNHFSCKCIEPVPAQIFYIHELDDEHCTTVFRETTLDLKINSLDCGNKMMNKDMYKALNEDQYPNIRIELLEVSQEKCDPSQNSTGNNKLVAYTRISLNGKTRDYWMKVMAKEMSLNTFHFVTNKAILMSDFGITPPLAALGMVKVRDEINISLDMVVSIE